MIWNDYEKIYSELAKSYKALRIASDLRSSSSVRAPVFILPKLPVQRHRPSKRPRIDLAKSQHGLSSTLLADRLR